MALLDELAKLHEVQKIDFQLYQREQAIKSLDGGDRQKREAINLIKQSDLAIAIRQKLEAELRIKELELKTVEGKRDSVHEKLYSGRVSNPKELRDLEHDEESLNAHISELEGPILDLMEQVEQAKVAAETLAAQVTSAKRIWKETVARSQTETERLQAEISALRPLREEAAVNVEKPLLQRYDDIRTRRDGIGLAMTQNDTCPACHIKLTAHFMRELRMGEDLLCCENCGRIIAWIAE